MDTTIPYVISARSEGPTSCACPAEQTALCSLPGFFVACDPSERQATRLLTIDSIFVYRFHHGHNILERDFRLHNVRGADEQTSAHSHRLDPGAHFGANLLRSPKGQRMLDADGSPEREVPAVALLQLDRVQAFRLHGIEDIHANLNQLRDHRLHVSVAVVIDEDVGPRSEE